VRTRVAAVCTSVVLLVLAGTAGAGADTVTTRDTRGDVEYWESSTQTGGTRGADVDILRTRVRYENGSLVVRTLFRDLTSRNTTITARVTALHEYRFDTNPDRRGYEYVVDDARGQNLHRSRPGADRRVPCRGLAWRANLRTDVTTLVLPRRCLRAGERRVVRTGFEIWLTGPGRAPAGDGMYYLDSLQNSVVIGDVRHSRSG
jgi:hypothetical protein